MNTIKIYIGHALTGAPQEFLDRMEAIRNRVSKLRNVEILRFAWIHGVGTDHSVKNVFFHDMKHVEDADLVVIVFELLSPGASMEHMRRCEVCLPLRAFVPKGQKMTRIIGDCIKHYRASRFGSKPFKRREMPDPIEYSSDEEIFAVIAKWVDDRNKLNAKIERRRKAEIEAQKKKWPLIPPAEKR